MYKSGWWFPLRVYSTKKFPSKNGLQGDCDFDTRFDANLNGIYNRIEEFSNRTIAICDRNKPIDDCFFRDENGIYQFRGSTIKLGETRIFLGNSMIIRTIKLLKKSPDEKERIFQELEKLKNIAESFNSTEKERFMEEMSKLQRVSTDEPEMFFSEL